LLLLVLLTHLLLCNSTPVQTLGRTRYPSSQYTLPDTTATGNISTAGARMSTLLYTRQPLLLLVLLQLLPASSSAPSLLMLLLLSTSTPQPA
jgi:hypothetical protein